MKFNLYDYVKYTDKNSKLDITGTIIAIVNPPKDSGFSRHYMIEVEPKDGKNISNWRIYRQDVATNNPNTQYIANRFGPERTWHVATSKSPVIIVGIGSRNLQSVYVPYDPNQLEEDGDL